MDLKAHMHTNKTGKNLEKCQILFKIFVNIHLNIPVNTVLIRKVRNRKTTFKQNYDLKYSPMSMGNSNFAVLTDPFYLISDLIIVQYCLFAL